MIRFITEHRDRFGVELICQVLRPAVRGFLTSRGYRAAVSRAPSARRLQDDLLVPEVARLHAENYGVYGRRKMHALLQTARAGRSVGRDQTERLMRLAVCSRECGKLETGIHHQVGIRLLQLPADLVQSPIHRRPARAGSGSADVTYVATWSGFAYVAFVTDVLLPPDRGMERRSDPEGRHPPAPSPRHGGLGQRARKLDRAHAPFRPWVELHGLGLHRPDRRTRRRPPRPEPLATATTTLSPRLSMGSTKPSSSAGNADPGAPSSRSNSRPSSGCGGGTTSASTASSTCAPPSRSSGRTTLTWNQPKRHLPDKQSDRNESQADSVTILKSTGSAPGPPLLSVHTTTTTCESAPRSSTLATRPPSISRMPTEPCSE